MSNFIGIVYGTLKEHGIDTSKMSVQEAIKKFNEINGNKLAGNNKNERQTNGNFSKEKTYANVNLSEKDVDKDINFEKNIKEQQLNELEKISTEFEKQVDAVLNGTYKDSHITLCEETPKILQEIGVPNKPFLMTAKHAYLVINDEGKYTAKNDNYHGLGKNLFLNIPKLLQSPIMVFKTHNSEKEIIAVVNAIDKNKNPIILPIKINGSGRRDFIQVEANIVKSAYGKNNLQSYIDKNVKEEDMLLIENKKIRNLNFD